MQAIAAAFGTSQSKSANFWTKQGSLSAASLPISCSELPNLAELLGRRGPRTKSSPRWPHGLPCALRHEATAKRELEASLRSGEGQFPDAPSLGNKHQGHFERFQNGRSIGVCSRYCL